MKIDGFNNNFLGSEEPNTGNKKRTIRGGVISGGGSIEDVLEGMMSAMFGGDIDEPTTDAHSMMISIKYPQDADTKAPSNKFLDELEDVLAKCDTKTLKAVSRSVTEELKKRGLLGK